MCMMYMMYMMYMSMSMSMCTCTCICICTCICLPWHAVPTCNLIHLLLFSRTASICLYARLFEHLRRSGPDRPRKNMVGVNISLT